MRPVSGVSGGQGDAVATPSGETKSGNIYIYICAENSPGGGESRNHEIDFFRIFMAYVVAVHHIAAGEHPFVGGYLAVEFFFMLSGYYAMEKAVRNPGASYRHALLWTGKTFLKFFPYVLLGVLVGYGVNAGVEGPRPEGPVWTLTSILYEISLAAGLGIREAYLDGVLWYMAAMLIALPLFYAAAVKAKGFSLGILCPVSVCLVYAYFAVTVGHIDAWDGWLGWCFQSLPRAWAGLCLGGVLFAAAGWIRGLRLTTFARHALSLGELLCLGAAVWYMWTHSHEMLDFACIGALALFALMVFSGRASIHSLFRPFWSRIAELSVAVYVGHISIVALLPKLFPGQVSYPARLLVYLVMVTALAAVLMAAVSLFRRLSLGKRLKTVLIDSKAEETQVYGG